MRPRPSEIIAGVRAVLAETIAPELTSEHARSRLAEIRAVLAQIDWDSIGFELMARTESLSRELRNARRFADVGVPEPPTEKTADAYRRYHEQLAAAATVALAALRAHLSARPADDEARAAYRALLESL
ncbi:hypothetical protein [Nocardia brevicatena]|uniref:hypothetical protein n=1 Tax=Nocardia brevicatena TaxID=37327 RepID=UPI0002F567A3|nr:hypothetical protein [Nocardia brevicatena]